jgi:hypothetical protein
MVLSYSNGYYCRKGPLPEKCSMGHEHGFREGVQPHFGCVSAKQVKISGGSSSRSGGLLPSHSLALSDLSARDFTDADEEFVNPFIDESNIVNRNDLPRPPVLNNR